MKKTTLVTILSFVVVFSYSQVKYGISGGINLASMKLESNVISPVGAHPRFGFNIGVGAEWLLKNNFSLINEFKLTSKNYAFDVADLYGASRKGYDRYNLMYIDVPFRACYTVNNLRVFAGAYFNYLVDSKNINQIEYSYNKILENSDLSNVTKSANLDSKEEEVFPLNSHYPFDAGPQVGIGYHNGNYVIDLVYSKGLFNLFPESNTAERPDYSLKNQSINIGFFFFL